MFEQIQMEKRSYRRNMLLLNGLIFGCLLALCTLAVWDLWADDVRKTLRVPPSHIYKSMLRFCDKKEYTKIEKSIWFVHPILVRIQEDFEIDLEKEIRETIATGQQQESK